MPVIYHKHHKITLRWKKEWNDTLLRISHDPKYRNGLFIDWKKAEADGLLKGLPSVSLRQLSKRASNLRIKEDPERLKKWKETRARYQEKHPIKSLNNIKKCTDILRQTPPEKSGVASRFIHSKWTETQDKLLLILADDKRFKKGKYINWKKLLKDPLAVHLPTRDRRQVQNRHNRLVHIKKRRQKALEWKYNNRDRYNKIRQKRIKQMRSAINKILYDELEH